MTDQNEQNQKSECCGGKCGDHHDHEHQCGCGAKPAAAEGGCGGSDKPAEAAQKETMAGLRSASGFIKSRLAKEINLRITPEVQFIMDQSIAYGVNMSHKIDMVMADQRAKKGEEEDA